MKDTEITERWLFVSGKVGFNRLGQCSAVNIAFNSSLLEGLFLNNGDVPGSENIATRGEVLIGKSKDGCEIQRWQKYFCFRPAE